MRKQGYYESFGDYKFKESSLDRWGLYAPLADELLAHTIVGDTPEPFSGFDSDIYQLWDYVLIPCGFTRSNVFGSNVPNDRIVAGLSQRASLIGSMTNTVSGTDHFTVRNSNESVEKIRLLLDEPFGSGSFIRE